MHKIGLNINQLAKAVNTTGAATPDKTDSQQPVSSFGYASETVDLEFAITAEMAKNNVMEKGDRDK